MKTPEKCNKTTASTGVEAEKNAKIGLLMLPKHATGQMAMQMVLKQLQLDMSQHEGGVREDCNIECLHDFRVAIRRTRSVLRQVKGIWPSEKTERFNTLFQDIGRNTGRVRDLDVCLLSEAIYRSLLPEALQEGMTGLFALLKKARRLAYRKMVVFLNASTYGVLKADWERFLTDPGAGGPNAEKPAVVLAQTWIYKRYRHVVTCGRSINEESPDEHWHQLRIECKKLRYLLEFFASLFPQESMQELIGQLKGLQDLLGHFNDLSVQQSELLHVIGFVLPKSRQKNRLMIAAATGGLIARLYDNKQQIRATLGQTFAAFDTPGQAEVYDLLYRQSVS